MDTLEFRQKFKLYLDDHERYRKFLALINRNKENRLLFWQERLIEKFCEKYSINLPDFSYLKQVFAICEIHETPLEQGKVKVFRGHLDYSRKYEKACIENFPNSYLSEINGPKECHGMYIDIYFCPSCREAQKVWTQKNVL